MNDDQTRCLDFLIIGAQKAGTTSLYKYLSKHRGLYLPPEKEAGFFHNDKRYYQGWEKYAKTFFANAPSDRLFGKATPSYLGDMRVPERIAHLMPGVKLIALLRDPVERAFSHYKMSVRRNRESRTFDDAVHELLYPSTLERSRLLVATLENEINCYIVWGEYGRMLNQYMKWFPKKHILVVFADDLASNPISVYKTICRFIGVDSDEIPENIGKRYHEGGTANRFPSFDKLNQFHILSIFWHLIPLKRRRRIKYWYELWNIKPSDGNERVISPNTRDRLARHYKTDLLVLKSTYGCDIPWEYILAK